MRISVPGNIILLGEYAVLQEGGLGVAFAVERRVRLEAEPAQSLSVKGVWPGGSFQWAPGRESGSLIVSAAYAAVREWMRTQRGAQQGSEQEVPALRIQVDSSELYSHDGRKSGFGSSAAVAVALVAAFRADGRRDEATAQLALAAHRSAQGGGRGSGYDVCCSFYGGWGLFRGGASPSWEPHDPSISVRVHLFRGPTPVSTQNAIQSFLQWKKRNREAAEHFVDESDANVRAFLAADNPGEASAAFRRARETGINLGDEIGVQARIPAPAGVDPQLCKSLGAGNELGAYLQVPGAPEPPAALGLSLAQVASSGITWQP